MSDLTKWNKIFRNQPAFILGTGPSIDDIDLSILDGFITIGVNRILLKYDPLFLYWQDPSLWKDHKKQILKMSCLKLPAYMFNADEDFENPYSDEPFKSNETFISSKTQHVKHTNIISCFVQDNILYFIRTSQVGASGVLATQLARYLGCSPIILLGMDGKYSENKTNFHGKSKYHTQNTLPIYQISMNWLKQHSKYNEIKNCSGTDGWKKENIYSLAGILKKYKKTKEILLSQLLE